MNQHDVNNCKLHLVNIPYCDQERNMHYDGELASLHKTNIYQAEANLFLVMFYTKAYRQPLQAKPMSLYPGRTILTLTNYFNFRCHITATIQIIEYLNKFTMLISCLLTQHCNHYNLYTYLIPPYNLSTDFARSRLRISNSLALNKNQLAIISAAVVARSTEKLACEK